MKLGCTIQIYNEELLLPSWIEWHWGKIFDFIWFVNHGSTDRSVEIIKEMCPGARIFENTDPIFDAGAMDRMVSEVEHQMKLELAPDWMISLNVTEYIFTPPDLLKDKLQVMSTLAPDMQAFGMRSFCLVDKELNNSLNLLDHSTGYVDYERGVEGARRWRYIHNWLWGNYHLGRHGTALQHTHCPELLIAYYQFAPFPLCKQRKQQIGPRIQGFDRSVGNGHQHLVNETDEGFFRVYGEECARSYDLFEFPLYKEYYDIWRQRLE